MKRSFFVTNEFCLLRAGMDGVVWYLTVTHCYAMGNNHRGLAMAMFTPFTVRDIRVFLFAVHVIQQLLQIHLSPLLESYLPAPAYDSDETQTILFVLRHSTYEVTNDAQGLLSSPDLVT